MFPLILFSTVFILLFLPLYFGNLVFVSIFISRKLHFLFSDCSWQPTFVFISVLSSCISLRTLFMFCFTMAPVFPTSAAFCSWAIWADHSAAFLGRADYLYVPVVLPVVLHSVSSCAESQTRPPQYLPLSTRAVACEGLQVGTLCFSSLICNLAIKIAPTT